MTREPVNSSNLKSVGYDKDTKTLQVEFHTGAVHEYANVPLDKHAQMMKAKSVGGYFHTHIRNFYDGKRIV